MNKLYDNLSLNQQRCLISGCISIFLILSQPIFADPPEILEKYYLSKFKGVNIEQVTKPVNEATYLHYTPAEQMSPKRQRKILLHFLHPQCYGNKKIYLSQPVHYQNDVWADTGVFQTGDKAHLYDALFPGTTLLGEVYGACALVTGASFNIHTLDKRQKLIAELMKNQTGLGYINKVADHLQVGLAIFDKKNPLNYFQKLPFFMLDEVTISRFFGDLGFNEKEFKYAIVDYNIQGNIAKQSQILSYAPMILGVINRLINFKMTSSARVLNYRPWKHTTLLKGITYPFMKLGGYAEYILAPYYIVTSLQTMHSLHNSFKQTNHSLTEKLLELEPFLHALFDFKAVTNLPIINFSLYQDELHYIDLLFDNISQLNRNCGHAFQFNLPVITSSVRILMMLRKTIVRFLQNVSALDFYYSIARQVQDQTDFKFVQFDYPSPVSTPFFDASGLKHPLLPLDKAIPSDVKLGGEQPASFILSGVNTSGKTTLLRSIGINTIFLAQTIGVATSEVLTLQPFTHFSSLIEKKDKYGKSSYETEVQAIENLWSFYESSSKIEGTRGLIIADELLRTTNAEEGEKLSSLIAKKIASLPGVSLLVSTHFQKLQTMAEENPELFMNKHMAIELSENDEITNLYYQLTEGVSPAKNGISLLQEKLKNEYPEYLKYLD